MQRLEELQTLEEAIGLKKDELKQHHEIEVRATSLDELEAQIIAQRKAWDEEQAEKRASSQNSSRCEQGLETRGGGAPVQDGDGAPQAGRCLPRDDRAAGEGQPRQTGTTDQGVE